jgi:PII-like signaling protein
MVKSGPAKKLCIYVDESYKINGKPAFEAVLAILYRRKVAGASVFRGIEGYGSDGVFHTAKILELSSSLPVKIEAVDSEEMINSVLLEITPLIHKGLIAVSDTTVIKCCTREEGGNR